MVMSAGVMARSVSDIAMFNKIFSICNSTEKIGIMIFAGAERALLTGGTCMGMTILGKAIIYEGPTARAVQFEAHPFPLSCELPALCLQLQDSPVCICVLPLQEWGPSSSPQFAR